MVRELALLHVDSRQRLGRAARTRLSFAKTDGIA
jgi:hypothetical protein